jgi:hypothetical protein
MRRLLRSRIDRGRGGGRIAEAYIPCMCEDGQAAERASRHLLVLIELAQCNRCEADDVKDTAYPAFLGELKEMVCDLPRARCIFLGVVGGCCGFKVPEVPCFIERRNVLQVFEGRS